MKSQNKNTEIADKIIGILRKGLTINADTQHYIDSTFSNPTLAELKALLQDESSCETDSLMELLLFPDESVQLQLENLLEEAQLQKQDEQAIQALVCGQPFQTRLYFHGGKDTLKMAASPSGVNPFIERLNLSRGIDPKLRAAIAQYVPRTLQTRCQVRFRNARPITASHKVSFLQSFFEKIKFDDDEFFEYLDFTISFLGGFKDKADIFTELMKYKKIYFQGLQKAAKLEVQLTKHNVETLLLSGTRVAYVDKADARNKIQMIDRISLAVFGKTDFFDLMPADEQIMTLEGKADMDQLMKDLS